MEEIKKRLLFKEDNLSKFACKSKDVIRLKEEKEDLRPAFFHDTDKIIYSLSYSRYIDKTQVFSYEENDHISRRMIHVQFVSKIARTIGRMLNLNEDLIEAAALGHDLGHPPLGHVGEEILNEISQKELLESFLHNIQSVRVMMFLDRDGEGSNVSVQVMDAIMCHNGEVLEQEYRPKAKTKEEFLDEYYASYKDADISKNLRPMTLEGCVVRIADVIGYIGRDIEDAIRVGLIKREELPKNIVNVLGDTNSKIVNTIVLDIVKNSYGKSYISLSDEVFKAVNDLKDFNYKNIYFKANTKEDLANYKKQINFLFYKYLKDLDTKDKTSFIYKNFIKIMSDEYNKNNSNKRKVLDFISGMTDDYLLLQYEKERLLKTG